MFDRGTYLLFGEENIMNPQLQFIFSRRSIRKYTNREIPDTMIDDLLAAAMAAPSANAKDPWHFVVVKSPSALQQLADTLPYGKMLNEAAAALVVCGDLDQAHGRELSYLLQDVSAASENILLAATALGLGSCWLGVHPREERIRALSKQFNLPQSVLPVAVIALGWPAQEAAARTRYQTTSVHRETW